MDDLHREMHQIRENCFQVRTTRQMDYAESEFGGIATSARLQTLFNELGHDFSSGDQYLNVQQAQGDPPGFTVTYDAYAPKNCPPFAVTATCAGDNVEINTQDGHWEHLSNVLGNWGHWTDAKSVYTGEYNETHIRRALETEFLAWYQTTLNKQKKFPESKGN